MLTVPGTLPACGGTARSAPPGGLGPPGEASVEWNRLRFTTEILAAPADRLRIRASVENLSSEPRLAEIPVCFPWIRLYLERRLVWEQWPRSCETAIRTIDLPALGTWTDQVTLRAVEMLGDSLPAAVYSVAAVIPSSHRPGRPPRAEMEVLLGRARLGP